MFHHGAQAGAGLDGYLMGGLVLKAFHLIFRGISYGITGLFFVLFWVNLVMRIGFSHIILLRPGAVHVVLLGFLFLIQWIALAIYDDLVLRILSLLTMIPALLLVKQTWNPVVFSQATISLICFILATVYLFIFIFQRKKPEHIVRQKCIRAVAVFGIVLFFCLLFFVQFGLPHDFEKIRVNQTLASPSQEYTAYLCQYEGGTYFSEQAVYVCCNDSVDLFPFRLIPTPTSIYFPQADERIDMHWRNDRTLVINDQAYSF